MLGLLISPLMERMAWRFAMECERGVWYEKGAVTKKVVFSSTNIAGRKRAFSRDPSVPIRPEESQTFKIGY
jgi:hypothetical protein